LLRKPPHSGLHVVINKTIVAPQRKSVEMKTNMLEHAVVSTVRLPNSLKNWRASLLIGPWDSTAIGTNSSRDENPAYTRTHC